MALLLAPDLHVGHDPYGHQEGCNGHSGKKHGLEHLARDVTCETSGMSLENTSEGDRWACVESRKVAVKE